MKNLTTSILILFATCFVFTSCDKDESPEKENFKIYDIESGIVTYTTTVTGSVGSGTIEGLGTVQLYFKKWGALIFENEEYTTTTTVKIPISNQVIVDTDIVHNTSKTDYEMHYEVDYGAELIYSFKTPIIEFMQLYDYDVKEAARRTLLSTGGQQLDNEMYKGYDCEVWTALASTIWVYEGVVLKMITTLGGQIRTKEAVDIKFNISVSDDHFQLPDYKITPIEG